MLSEFIQRLSENQRLRPTPTSTFFKMNPFDIVFENESRIWFSRESDKHHLLEIVKVADKIVFK